jgi:hypothetical protein
MDKRPARGKKRAKAMEKGVCIICGEERTGTPAAPELPVSAARRLRAAFHLPARHTVACGEHLAEAKGKRAKFVAKARGYLLGAAAFFALVLIGGLFFGKLDSGTALPALLGAAIIAALPSPYYFPPFGE